MFTGIVERMGQVHAIISEPPGVRLVVVADSIAEDAQIGDSIAVNGCCLTVVEIDGDTFAFEAGEETLSRTDLGRLVAGTLRIAVS